MLPSRLRAADKLNNAATMLARLTTEWKFSTARIVEREKKTSQKSLFLTTHERPSKTWTGVGWTKRKTSCRSPSIKNTFRVHSINTLARVWAGSATGLTDWLLPIVLGVTNACLRALRCQSRDSVSERSPVVHIAEDLVLVGNHAGFKFCLW